MQLFRTSIIPFCEKRTFLLQMYMHISILRKPITIQIISKFIYLSKFALNKSHKRRIKCGRGTNKRVLDVAVYEAPF